MPTSPNVGANAAGLAGPGVKRLKAAYISAADNGFVISLDKTADYGQTIKIASTPEEISSIISTYFA